VKRDQPVAPRRLEFIETKIGNDAVHPGREFGFWSIALGRLPNPHKEFLGEVLGPSWVPNKPMSEIQDPSLMAPDQDLKGIPVPLGRPGHEPFIRHLR
jgi:hypothetical protein